MLGEVYGADITIEVKKKDNKTFYVKTEKLEIMFEVGQTICSDDHPDPLTISRIETNTNTPTYRFEGTSEWIHIGQQKEWRIYKPD